MGFEPGSLPSLRSLSVTAPANGDVIGGLLAAAGPKLTSIQVGDAGAAIDTALWIGDEDFPWLASLQKLTLDSADLSVWEE